MKAYLQQALCTITSLEEEEEDVRRRRRRAFDQGS